MSFENKINQFQSNLKKLFNQSVQLQEQIDEQIKQVKYEEIKLGEVLDVKRGTSLSGKFYENSGKYIRLTLGNFTYPECGWKDNTSKDDLYYSGDFQK